MKKWRISNFKRFFYKKKLSIESTASYKNANNKIIISKSRQKNKLIKDYIGENKKFQLFYINKKYKTLYNFKKLYI